MRSIQVVAAVIMKDQKIFATQRGYGDSKDGWEFPGGKIEKGETPAQALAREIREELDTEISVGVKLTQVEYEKEDFHLSMGCYFCRVVRGDLTLREHEAARWLSLETIDSVSWLPADQIAVKALKRYLETGVIS